MLAAVHWQRHLVRREDDDFLPVASRLEVREELVLCEREEATAEKDQRSRRGQGQRARRAGNERVSGQIETAARRSHAASIRRPCRSWQAHREAGSAERPS